MEMFLTIDFMSVLNASKKTKPLQENLKNDFLGIYILDKIVLL